MRGAVVLGAAAAAALAAGCTVGDGTGSAIGPLFVDGCNFGVIDPVTGALAPKTFTLEPSFFAGEPIEDIASPPENRLVIRMQRNGNRIEVNDTLYFDVQNTFEVARCLRGRVVNGVPDWDTSGWCDWSGTDMSLPCPGAAPVDAGPAGGDGAAILEPDGGVLVGAGAHARIRITYQGLVRSSLAPLSTCPMQMISGSGTQNLTAMAVDGWIDFQDFGGALQADRAPADRDKVNQDFTAQFGDRLRATFHVVLDDQRKLVAIQDMMPIPRPEIGGCLDGSFDFDLERGRGAQPFP
jgi:hypothetical protein